LRHDINLKSIVEVIFASLSLILILPVKLKCLEAISTIQLHMAFTLAQRGQQRLLRAGKLVKLGHLEEVRVVTRFPSSPLM
jgi:hypothetical protein